MGGPSSEREVSLRSGRQVLAALDRERYIPVAAEVTEKGHFKFAKPGEVDPDFSDLEGTLTPGRALDMMQMLGFEMAFVALHGPFGEDGTVQALLESHRIPYTGSGVAASAIAMDKALTRFAFAGVGIPVAPGAIVTRREWMELGDRWIEKALPETVRAPWFVKPTAQGSSVGVRRCANAPELGLAIEEALRFGNTALIEQEIVGVEITCGVLGNAAGELQALPIVEILPRKGAFFTYEEKYDAAGAEEICPPRHLDPSQIRQAQEMALRAHRVLGCDGMSRVDMIAGKSGITAIELNTIPGLTERSLLPLAAATAGIPFSRLLDRLIDLALERFGKK